MTTDIEWTSHTRWTNNLVVPHRLLDMEAERGPMSGAGTISAGTHAEESDAGRVAAFQRLADQRLDASYRLANAILGDEGQAQDAVHDAVILAWQRWPALRERARFDAWFDRIVVNVCRDRLRQAARRRASDIADVSLSTPDATAEIHRRLLVEQALARLKPDEQLIASTLGDLGVTEWSIRTDGGVAYPVGERDAYVQHTDKGCYVYGGRQRDAAGRLVYYIGGAGSVDGPGT
jgi:RNA polymerase sigma-70 factor, ECF subfamily